MNLLFFLQVFSMIIVAGLGVAIIVLCIYLGVCLINKNLGLDKNGNTIKKQHINPTQHVVKIEVVSANKSNINHNKNPIIEGGSLMLSKKNMEVESSFKGKKIGKVT